MISSHLRSTFCGTIDYMAPEMIKNSPYDYKLDIWCLGILLYELIHGKPPFSGENKNETVKNILKCGTITFEESISPKARELIRSILKLNPNDRPSMDQLFHHPWMLQFEKNKDFKIETYIWKEENNSETTINSFHEKNKDSFNNDNTMNKTQTYSQFTVLDKYLKEIGEGKPKNKEPGSRGKRNEDDSMDRIQKQKKDLDDFLANNDDSASKRVLNQQFNGNYGEKPEEDQIRVGF